MVRLRFECDACGHRRTVLTPDPADADDGLPDSCPECGTVNPWVRVGSPFARS